MKSIQTLVTSTCLVVLAAGCASGPKFSEYRSTLAAPEPGYGRVWFYRPSAMGAGVQPAIKMDDQKVGNAVPHGFFHVETLPGAHEVSAKTEWKHKATINVSTNSDSYVRLNMMIGFLIGHVIPKEVPESQALNDLSSLRLASPKATN